MDRKYQVFISSTFIDLKDERVEIMEALINLGHIPIGMELFNAADDTQWGVIKRRIDESDYYVLLLSDRYGSIDSDGIGFTEKEYNYALKQNKPIISFVRDKKGIESLSFEHRESENRKKLDEFKSKVSSRLFKAWETKYDLSKKFFLAFAELIRDSPQNGWVRFESLDQQNKIQFGQIVNENQKLIEENRKHISEIYKLQSELEQVANIRKKAESIINILPKKDFQIREYKFNGLELVGLFGSFVAVSGPLNEIIDSIKQFIIVQTKDEDNFDHNNKDSIKYIVGSFASLGLIEITSETHLLHDEDSHKGDIRKRDEIKIIEMVRPLPLLHEVYSMIETINIDKILTANTSAEYFKKKKRLEELSDLKDDAYWADDLEKYNKRKLGKIESILTEFITHYKWSSEIDKIEFYKLNFMDDNNALSELYERAYFVLENQWK